MKTTSRSSTRRRFLSECAGLALSSVGVGKGQTQDSSRNNSKGSAGNIDLRLSKEFRNSYLLATSSDGRRLCLYFSLHPQDTFKLTERAVQYDRSDNFGDALQVIDLDSWKAVYSVHLRHKAHSASFFQDNDHIYAETLPIPDEGLHVGQNVWIDLRNRKLEERLTAVHPNGFTKHYSALRDSILLGSELDGQTGRYISLIRATLPDYQEIARASFTIGKEPEPLGHDTDVVVSADRTLLGYGADHTIVCRRTETLEVIWSRQVEPEYFGAVRLAISANGSRVAAAVLDTTFIEQQRHYYIGIFEGKDGAEVARLPLNGGAGIAISPDGRMLAVGERLDPPAGSKETQLVVSIFDVASGQRIDTVIHDRFRIGRGEWVNSHFGVAGIQFSSDGKNLITSGTHTKIWELSRL